MAGEGGSRIIDAAVAAEPGIKENYATLYERILREGEARVIEKGIEQGIERGEATVVERLLRLKFGELPADVRARVAQAKSAELERWAERILCADSIALVFEDTSLE